MLQNYQKPTFDTESTSEHASNIVEYEEWANRRVNQPLFRPFRRISWEFE